MKKILLIDYPYPDGQAREDALREMGFDTKVFDLVKSRIWPGEHPVKNKLKPLLSAISPIKACAAVLRNSRVNKELIDVVSGFRPEIILIVKGDSLSGETLKRLRDICSPLILMWDADSMLSPGRKEFMIPRLGLYDYYFTVDEIDLLPKPLLKDMFSSSRNIYSMPFAANTKYYKPMRDEKSALAHSVVFMGTINPVRKSMLEHLSDLDLKIWAPASSPWGKWLDAGSPLEKHYMNGCLYGEDLVKAYSNAGVVLDIHFLFSKISDIPNVTMRTYEIPASGGFLLANYSPQLTRFFKLDEEMACYRTESEFKEKTLYYLNNPGLRCQMAAKARERILREHTFKHRIESILRILNVSN